MGALTLAHSGPHGNESLLTMGAHFLVEHWYLSVPLLIGAGLLIRIQRARCT